ncbi:recombinase family protein [Pseudonocardia eucalypti]|uniref:Recombinase family protein n=1 Tax=Pseudonocardia eucalypti TaxID=648755 RepID=A0ABP9QBT2_9PSEU
MSRECESDDQSRRADQRRHSRRRVIDELRTSQQDDESPALRRAADAVLRSGQQTQPFTDNAGIADIAFIYVRVSTREQARTGGGEEGYSIPVQRAAGVTKAEQLGAVVGGIYIDAGQSAKSAHRPELQRMLRDIAEQRPRYVIVHKIDRLARNRLDDVAINMALRKAGCELVSCTESISDTPSGKFLYNIMADMAQFYSDNLAQEVLKGMIAKAQEGGTPFRPPLGYLPFREYRDGIAVSTVIVDPQRAPLMKWAFEQYATGDWTSLQLAEALQEKGLTTRPTARRPERDVSMTSLLNTLRNPYYMGVVSYRGATYEGKHQALVTPELWLAVQDVLAVHAHAGEKDRVHTHYLRGTIFCGGCGRRLIFNRATGRHGGTFNYFICPKRHHEKVHCTRRSIRVERIEDGILALYQRLELPPETVHSIRLGVHAELAGESAEAHQQAERSNRRLQQLGEERAALMRAHYAGAVPLDLLKSEMDRLTRAMTAAERQVEVSGKHLAEVEAVLEQALAVAGECNVQYRRAPDFVKRQMNQGFYKRLWIAQDGTVERYELTEPFAALLGGDGLTAVRARVRGSNAEPTGFEAGEAVLGGESKTPTSVGGRGLNENVLVELRGLEPLTLTLPV